MKSTLTAAEAQAKLPKLLRELPKRRSVTITDQGRIAGFLVSKDRMEAIIESMEILANSEAMRAITEFEAGDSAGKDISALGE